MNELIKILDIRKIDYLYLSYIDNNGNFKEMKIEHPSEKVCTKEEN